MNIAERIKEIIIEQLRVDADEVVPSASFTDDLGADSLAVKSSRFNLQLII